MQFGSCIVSSWMEMKSTWNRLTQRGEGLLLQREVKIIEDLFELLKIMKEGYL